MRLKSFRLSFPRINPGVIHIKALRAYSAESAKHKSPGQSQFRFIGMRRPGLKWSVQKGATGIWFEKDTMFAPQSQNLIEMIPFFNPNSSKGEPKKRKAVTSAFLFLINKQQITFNFVIFQINQSQVLQNCNPYKVRDCVTEENVELFQHN